MVCDNCGKNQASVHLTEIINEKMSELHLCDVCAQEKGATMKQHFSLADLLAGLSEVGPSGTDAPKNIVCEECGLSYRDFKKIGRLGCGTCYTAFKQGLSPLLKRIHGSTRHVGHTPERSKGEAEAHTKIQGLSKKLEQAIELEEFEEAARIRDEIRKFEKAEKAKKKSRNPSKK